LFSILFSKISSYSATSQPKILSVYIVYSIVVNFS
jgi:hypothetical protein